MQNGEVGVNGPTGTTSDDMGRLGAQAAVILRTDGVHLPRTGITAMYRVPYQGLVLLSELPRTELVALQGFMEKLAARHGDRPMNFHLVLKELRNHELIRADEAPVAQPTSPAPERLPLTSAATALPDDLAVIVGTARLLRVVPGGFEAVDHDGHPVIRLTAVELAAASSMARLDDLGSAHRFHVEQVKEAALSREAFGELIAQLIELGIFEREQNSKAKDREAAMVAKAWGRALRARESLREHFEREARDLEELVATTGRPRAAIVPIHTQFSTPLSLGMLISYARTVDSGRLMDDYGFLPAAPYDEEQARPFVDSGSIFLFSNYVWSHASNLESSEKIKAANPRCITIHGGPDSPKYDDDVDAYFEANPFIDIVVHGEGEITFAELLTRLATIVHDEERDLSCLAGVPGLSYRGLAGAVRNGPRDRMTDINIVPSPYLSGLFDVEGGGDSLDAGAIDTAMLETNRGCPYSCTFCDWGSSTAARIRKFDLDRIFAEVEWLGRNKIERVFLCDANFGIFERDVEIAQKVADTYREYGYPRALITNYAKNTVKHLQKIVQIMAGAGVVTEGLLSLQSMDEDTLETIRRSNIKVEKYDALAAEFREAKLPLLVDLMIGLPGSTTQSLREDFQECIDREVNAKVFQTELLINSPMNHPDYRAENQIATERVDGAPAVHIPTRGSAGAGRALVVSSSSFTRADYDEMLQLRAVFRLVENFAVLRLTARYLRQAVGIREGDLLEMLRGLAHDEPDRWPHLSIAMRVVPEHMVPPVSWGPFIDEVRRVAVERLDAEPNSALDSVMLAQHSILPAPGRSFPHSVDLAHDVGAWYQDVLAAKDAGFRTTWTDQVAPVDTYPATRFVVDDPSGLCDVGMGFGIEVDPYASWELDSPVARVLSQNHVLLADN